MSYRSDVRIVLSNEDFKDLCTMMKAKYGREKYPLMKYLDYKSSDDKLTLFGWDSIKWYSDDPEEGDVLKFIENRNAIFFRAGENYDDLVCEEHEDPDQEHHPFPDEMYDAAGFSTDIVCNI